MTREGAIHLTCLYGPLVAAGMLAWWVRPGKLHATGLLFALAWNAALLPWLDGLARWFGMWTYHSQTAAIGGMPLALYFGWIIAWGLVAPLLAHVLGGRMWTAVAAVSRDRPAGDAGNAAGARTASALVDSANC